MRFLDFSSLSIALVIALAPVSPAVPAGAAEPVLEPPVAPSLLRGAVLDTHRLRLAWRDNACDDTEQRLQVEHLGRWVEVPFALDPDLETVMISGLQPSTTYSFRVIARNDAGDSPPSAPVSLRTFDRNPSCIADEERLCLLGGRFAVDASFGFAAPGDPADAGPVLDHAAHAAPDSQRAGAFWFFSPSNPEIHVVLDDRRSTDGHVGVTVAGLTDLPHAVTVTDTLTGKQRRYQTPAGTPCGLSDETAFFAGEEPAPEALPGPMAPAAATEPWKLHLEPLPSPTATQSSCVRAPGRLELFDGRFHVGVRYLAEDGRTLVARATSGTGYGGAFVTEEGADHPAWALKVVDGRAINGHFWIFASPLAGLEAWITLDDTHTGTRRALRHRAGDTCGHALVQGFPGSPSSH